MSAELPRSVEVVVVGGGVMGVSTAYHLAVRGCSDVLLLERDTLGSGSTGRAAGGIRAQFSDELNIRIALECIRRFERFAEEPGAEIDFKQWGYLFLLSDPEDVQAFHRSVARQRRLGVPSEVLSPEAAAEIVPGIVNEDLLAATFCPLDGYATPEAVVQGYAQAAARAGVRIVQGCTVSGIDLDAGRVAGVRTDRGNVASPRVVCTAGVWSRELAAGVGVELPIEPERRFVFVTEPGDPFRRELPLTIDFATGFYFHREGDAILFGGREDTIEALAPVALQRVPAIADLPIRASWWGYYELSPDRNAIVGAARELEGFVYGTGFSGHGFQQGPVVGEHLADLALGLEPAFDLSPFSVERFAGGGLRPERNVV
jgi:sarcosine oxidase subunit beta